MWAFLSRRFRQWALFALAVPVGRWLLGQVRERIAVSRGEQSRVVRTLSSTDRALGRFDRSGRGRRRRR